MRTLGAQLVQPRKESTNLRNTFVAQYTALAFSLLLCGCVVEAQTESGHALSVAETAEFSNLPLKTVGEGSFGPFSAVRR